MRNRQRLLDVAEELFAERGTSVGVAEIAEQAGVAAPTLYRHFGNKEGLIAAVGERRFEIVTAMLARAMAQPTAWESIRMVIDDGIEMARINRAVREMSGVEVPPRLERLMIAGWETLIERGRAEGVIRPDIEAIDLPFIFAAFQGVARLVRYDKVLVDRYVTLFMDSLRPTSTVPLPGSTPTLDQMRKSFQPGA